MGARTLALGPHSLVVGQCSVPGRPAPGIAIHSTLYRTLMWTRVGRWPIAAGFNTPIGIITLISSHLPDLSYGQHRYDEAIFELDTMIDRSPTCDVCFVGVDASTDVGALSRFYRCVFGGSVTRNGLTHPTRQHSFLQVATRHGFDLCNTQEGARDTSGQCWTQEQSNGVLAGR